MSKRDTELHGQFRPTIKSLAPSQVNGIGRQHVMPKPASAPSYPSFEARVSNLEEKHAGLRDEVDALADLYHGLRSTFQELEKGALFVNVGPSREVDPTESHRSAMHVNLKLKERNCELQDSVGKVVSKQDCNITPAPKINGGAASVSSKETMPLYVPPNLRKKIQDSASHENEIPKDVANESLKVHLVTNNPIDPAPLDKLRTPTALPSPPVSPTTDVESNLPTNMDKLSLGKSWKPHYLTTLSTLPSVVLSKIPVGDMVTFHPEFINKTLNGLTWSPGLKYIQEQGPCILKNRTYYVLDPKTEPFLPKGPGDHGAKLTAFFNKAPEDEFGPLEDGANSWEDVPMFVEAKDSNGRIRYTYYGNYSQTRWSDRLDYDTMTAMVPQSVKEHWATELTSSTREPWVTEELKKHFFAKPEYHGRLFAEPDDETTAVGSEGEIKLAEKMAKDVRNYVAQLRKWKREANMKTSMIKRDMILQAFETADADDPPALRLWWEYLECVAWNHDFYNLLVTLQSRNPDAYLK